MVNVEIAVDAHAVLGECPLWSPVERLLYWIDIEGRAVHCYDPATGSDETQSLDVRPGSMVLTGVPGRFLMAAENRVGWYEWNTGSFGPTRVLEPAGTGNRLNDGRTDRQGRYWVGSMYEDSGAGISTGMLHRVDADQSHSTHRRGIGVTNGIAFSPDGHTMYFTDSVIGVIWEYDYDPDTGERSNERVFNDFGELRGLPDGASVKIDGGYWVACVFGWAVARITPDGKVDRVVDVPVEKPSMPSFGGGALDRLFVTSISENTAPGSTQPHAGGLFVFDAGIAGIAETPYAG